MSGQSGKYERLKAHLQTQSASRLLMNFDQIASVLGVEHLPKSAVMYRTWWSNDARNHVQANSWLDAGYRTERVDTTEKTVVFVREGVAHGVVENAREFEPSDKRTGPHPMIGAMKGTFSIEPGYDLTQPAMPEWAELIDEKYGKEPSK